MRKPALFARTITSLLAFCIAAAGGTVPARAQFYVPDPMQLPMSSYINTSYISNSQLDKGDDSEDSRREQAQPTTPSGPASRPKSVAPSTKAASLSFQPVSAPFMAARMAAAHPAAQRDEAKALYDKMLSTYDQIASYYAVPRHDLSGSTAVLLIGSYEMYSGEQVSDQGVRAVLAQLRSGLAASPELASASPQARQAYYEQSAITGTLLSSLAKELKQYSNPDFHDKARQSAKAHLQSLLGVDADAVTIDDEGLSLE